jgi:glycosyltransferase involved in cell wall biosynthesis
VPAARRVLQVFQPRSGGVPTHVLELTLGLRRLGWEVEVAGPADSAVWPALRRAGVPLWPLPVLSEPGVADLPGRADARAARMLRRLDRSRRYAIVHAHSSRAGGIVRAALPRRDRLVYAPHCFAFTTGFSPARRLVYRAFEQALVPRTGRFVATCEWERSQARRLAGANGRTEVIANGVRSCQAQPSARALTQFAGGLPLAGMVAALRPQKDPLALVRAAAELARTGRKPSFRVAIVGNGPLAAAVEREIERLGVGDHVRRFPFEGEPWPYLRVLDLFVLPSLWEAFPIATLEAMACATPVLATDVGGVGEQVIEGHTGRLVPANDPAALAAALAASFEDRERLCRWGAAAHERFARRYTIDLLSERTSALYTAALGRG